MIECEVCGEACHGLPDGSPRCLKHLPEPAGSIEQAPPSDSAARPPVVDEPEDTVDNDR